MRIRGLVLSTALAVAAIAPAARAADAAAQVSRTPRPPEAKLYVISPGGRSRVTSVCPPPKWR